MNDNNEVIVHDDDENYDDTFELKLKELLFKIGSDGIRAARVRSLSSVAVAKRSISPSSAQRFQNNGVSANGLHGGTHNTSSSNDDRDNVRLPKMQFPDGWKSSMKELKRSSTLNSSSYHTSKETILGENPTAIGKSSSTVIEAPKSNGKGKGDADSTSSTSKNLAQMNGDGNTSSTNSSKDYYDIRLPKLHLPEGWKTKKDSKKNAKKSASSDIKELSIDTGPSFGKTVPSTEPVKSASNKESSVDCPDPTSSKLASSTISQVNNHAVEQQQLLQQKHSTTINNELLLTLSLRTIQRLKIRATQKWQQQQIIDALQKLKARARKRLKEQQKVYEYQKKNARKLRLSNIGSGGGRSGKVLFSSGIASRLTSSIIARRMAKASSLDSHIPNQALDKETSYDRLSINTDGIEEELPPSSLVVDAYTKDSKEQDDDGIVNISVQDQDDETTCYETTYYPKDGKGSEEQGDDYGIINSSPFYNMNTTFSEYQDDETTCYETTYSSPSHMRNTSTESPTGVNEMLPSFQDKQQSFTNNEESNAFTLPPSSSSVSNSFKPEQCSRLISKEEAVVESASSTKKDTVVAIRVVDNNVTVGDRSRGNVNQHCGSGGSTDEFTNLNNVELELVENENDHIHLELFEASKSILYHQREDSLESSPPELEKTRSENELDYALSSSFDYDITTEDERMAELMNKVEHMIDDYSLEGSTESLTLDDAIDLLELAIPMELFETQDDDDDDDNYDEMSLLSEDDPASDKVSWVYRLFAPEPFTREDDDDDDSNASNSIDGNETLEPTVVSKSSSLPSLEDVNKELNWVLELLGCNPIFIDSFIDSFDNAIYGRIEIEDGLGSGDCSVDEFEEQRQQIQQYHNRNARLNARPSPRSRSKRRGHCVGDRRPRSVDEEEVQRRYKVSFEPDTNIVE